MEESGVPVPLHYPRGKSPYIVKPSGESGSEGVRRLETEKDLRDFMEGTGAAGEWVAQEFLEGPSYSIEVIGVPGNYRTYTVTQIHMDPKYDCCRVTAPCPITEEQRIGFEEIGCRLAEMVQLHGIMDVEVIDDNGAFKVLEIDARIPSQTPTVVYHASGMNLLQELADIITEMNFISPQKDIRKVCAYEHFKVQQNGLVAGGEHIMCDAGPLKLIPGFFGADEVLTDYSPEKAFWYGTFIHWADTEEELTDKRNRLICRLEDFVSATGPESEVMG
jgi:pyrrolysine biosynthesis protein PylC